MLENLRLENHLPRERAQAKPKLTAEISLIKIKLLKSSPAKVTNSNPKMSRGLTKKAEPPPTRGSRKTKAAGDGGWLRRLVRPRSRGRS